MAEEKSVKNKKVKRPTALKRDIQDERRRLHNKQFRSSVKTTVRVLEEAIKTSDKAKAEEKLSALFSLMDKGVKTGVFKQNKADRTKSKFAKAV
ncbi:MAG: 30S ribosomal protein S20 [Chlamydiota bacterium]